MGRILIRLAVPNDQRRLIASGLLGPAPAGNTWDARLRAWFAEQQRAHRLILVADDGSTFLGMVHIVFKPPEGMNDPEVVNGKDVALMEHLRIRPKTPAQLAEQLANQLEQEVENLANKRDMTRLTYSVPGDSMTLVNQARGWGFVEFRVMVDGGKNLVFMRKRLIEFSAAPPPDAGPLGPPPGTGGPPPGAARQPPRR
jgi:hypothetical protein